MEFALVVLNRTASGMLSFDEGLHSQCINELQLRQPPVNPPLHYQQVPQPNADLSSRTPSCCIKHRCIGSNADVSNPTRTYRTQCVLTAGDSMAVDSRMADLRVAGIDWREGNGNSKLRFRWCVTNSLHPFLFADHPPRTPSVNSPRARSLHVELNAACP